MIRKFKIYNKRFNEVQAHLTYDTDTKIFEITLPDSYEGMYPDFVFSMWHKKGVRKLPEKAVQAWVESRIVARERNFLDAILADLGMTEYDEFALLLACHGESQMDYSCIIEEG